MKSSLAIKKFGNLALRNKNNRVLKKDIGSQEIKQLISGMELILESQKHGVGLAAPQVGKNIRLTIISTKPTPLRPKIKKQKLIAFNPEIIKMYGRKVPMWESCISISGNIFAEVPRYKKIHVRYYDHKAQKHEKILSGFIAHVFQHEVDHLNGILFVDKVLDTRSYMSSTEYRKMIRAKAKEPSK